MEMEDLEVVADMSLLNLELKTPTFLNHSTDITLWLRSSAWLEHWTFNPGVGGSNPLGAIFELFLKSKKNLNDSSLISS